MLVYLMLESLVKLYNLIFLIIDFLLLSSFLLINQSINFLNVLLGLLHTALPERAKTRRQTITPDRTRAALSRRQTDISPLQEGLR